MTPTIPTWRAWYRRVFDTIAAAWRSGDNKQALHQLDLRTLSDIGISRSERASIEAEATVRMRILRDARHG